MGRLDPTYVAAGPAPPRLPGGVLERGCVAAAALPERCWTRSPPGASPAGSAETISPAEVRVAHPQDSSPGFGKIGLFTRFISSPSAH